MNYDIPYAIVDAKRRRKAEKMKLQKYLERIGWAGLETEPNAESLRVLQRSHLLNIPFENLDIYWKRPIVLNTEKFFEKIVTGKRGGFCYELNGLFNELLLSLGFRTRLISARVFNGTVYGPEFDHAAIIATCADQEYLADVGFGEFSAEPLKFVVDLEQEDRNGRFVIRKWDNEYFDVAKYENGEWKSQYIFKDISRELSEFSEMCDFQQFSPDSHFTKGKMCSIMTADGRKTLTENKFIVTANDGRTETGIGSVEEFERVLRDEFAIDKNGGLAP